jgi:hypothetical protein
MMFTRVRHIAIGESLFWGSPIARLSLEFEEEGAEWGERQKERVGAILGGDVFGRDPAKIANAGAAVVCGIGVEDLLVKT